MSPRVLIASAVAVLAAGPATAQPYKPPPGAYRTSWVGNTFGGSGGPNGFGHWVQNGADEIEVTPDGTVVAGVVWDEAGRCVGLYKGGKVGRVVPKAAEGGPLADSAAGWGTGNNAVAADGNSLYVATVANKLLRFAWTPGDLDSAKIDQVADLPGKPVGLSARGGELAVVYHDRVEWRAADTLKPTGGFKAEGAADAAVAADGGVWLLADHTVMYRTHDGKDVGRHVHGLQNPTAVALAPDGRLVVCDDGPRQQVLVYDVADGARLVQTFGDDGGLKSGTPGEVAPTKLFGPRGANFDTAGNLYVACGYSNGPSGGLVLRAFAPGGGLNWEVVNVSFVDAYGFDPASDGRTVYGRYTLFDLDLDKPEPGTEWRLKGLTYDHIGRPADPRGRGPASTVVRNVGGKTLVYLMGQMGGGYRVLAHGPGDGLLLRDVGGVPTEPGEQWAWNVGTASADLWHGDAKGNAIRRYRLRGFTADGKPDFAPTQFESWPWPADFRNVRRVVYDDPTDALYVFGYLKGDPDDSWGVVGFTARRYDGWVRGDKAERWTVKLPVNRDGDGRGKPLSPQSVSPAGDYLFVGMCKPDKGKQHVHILRLADGGYVGSLVPGREVGGQAGWLDMTQAVQAFRRSDGEYLVLAEEDYRGKNLLYRWRPDGK